MYEIDFLLALVVTILVETIVLFILARKVFKIGTKEVDTPKLIFTGIIASFATLPYLWFVLPAFIFDRITFIILGEGIVFLIEAAIYYFFLTHKVGQALALSLVCNITSVIVGLLLF